MTNKVYWSISQLDYLKRPYELKLRGQEKTGTVLGGFLTMFIFIALTASFFTSYIAQQKKEQLITAGEEVHLQPSDSINQDKLNFVIGFEKLNQIYDENKNEIEMKHLEKYLNIEFFQVHKSLILHRIEDKKENLQYENCDKSDLDKMQLTEDIMLEKIYKQEDSLLLCPRSDFILQGNHIGQLFKTLQVSVKLKNYNICDERDDEECYENNKVVFDIINNIQMQIYLTSTEYVYENGNIQSKEFIKVIDLKLSYLIEAEQHLYFQPLVLQNIQKSFDNILDNSKIIGQEISGQKFSYEQIRYSSIEYDADQIAYINFNIQSSKQIFKVETSDSFFKFIQSLSEVGGLFTSVFFSTSLIYQFYHRHKVYESLINESFLFDLKDDKASKKKKSHWFNLDQTGASKYNQRNPLVEMYDHKVKYSFLEYVKTDLAQKFGCRKRISHNQYLFYKAKRKLQNDLDLVHIVKKFQEIDKLKLMLMKKDQLIVFNSLIQPLIEVNQEKKQQEQSRKMSQSGSNFTQNQGSPVTDMHASIVSHMNMKNQPLQKAYQQFQKDYELKSHFFVSNINVLNPLVILKAYQNIKQDVLVPVGCDSPITNPYKKVMTTSNYKLNQSQRQNPNLNSSLNMEKVEFKDYISERLINVLQSNKTLFKLIQQQERMIQGGSKGVHSMNNNMSMTNVESQALGLKKYSQFCPDETKAYESQVLQKSQTKELDDLEIDFEEERQQQQESHIKQIKQTNSLSQFGQKINSQSHQSPSDSLRHLNQNSGQDLVNKANNFNKIFSSEQRFFADPQQINPEKPKIMSQVQIKEESKSDISDILSQDHVILEPYDKNVVEMYQFASQNISKKNSIDKLNKLESSHNEKKQSIKLSLEKSSQRHILQKKKSLDSDTPKFSFDSSPFFPKLQSSPLQENKRQSQHNNNYNNNRSSFSSTHSQRYSFGQNNINQRYSFSQNNQNQRPSFSQNNLDFLKKQFMQMPKTKHESQKQLSPKGYKQPNKIVEESVQFETSRSKVSSRQHIKLPHLTQECMTFNSKKSISSSPQLKYKRDSAKRNSVGSMKFNVQRTSIASDAMNFSDPKDNKIKSQENFSFQVSEKHISHNNNNHNINNSTNNNKPLIIQNFHILEQSHSSRSDNTYRYNKYHHLENNKYT